MVIIVAAAFFMCWTPFYLVNIISQNQEYSFLRRSNFLFTMLSTHLVGFLNSCVNPFIYCFLSEKFRNSFRNIIMNTICRCTMTLSMGKPSCCHKLSQAHAQVCTACAISLMHLPSVKINRMSWRTSAQYKSGSGLPNGPGEEGQQNTDNGIVQASGNKGSEYYGPQQSPKLYLRSSLSAGGNVELIFESSEEMKDQKKMVLPSSCSLGMESCANSSIVNAMKSTYAQSLDSSFEKLTAEEHSVWSCALSRSSSMCIVNIASTYLLLIG